MGIFVLLALVLTICLAQRSTQWLPARRQVAGTTVSPLLKSTSGWEWTWLEQDLSKEDKIALITLGLLGRHGDTLYGGKQMAE